MKMDVQIILIPNDLVSIIKSFQKSSRNKEIEELLIQWSNKVIDFIQQLWTQRNKDMIEWEKLMIFSKWKKEKRVQVRKLNQNAEKDAFRENGFYIIILLMKNFMIKLNK